ncbi:MAG: methyl-accepting chemotaxis protein [Clostridiaceae bacterium]
MGKSIFSNQVISSIVLIIFSLSVTGFISYTISKNTVKSQFNNSTNQILNQNIRYADLFSKTIETTSKKMMQDDTIISALESNPDNVVDAARNTRTLNTEIKKYYTSDALNSIVSIALFTDDNVYGSTNKEKNSLLTEANKTDWFINAKEASSYSSWIKPNLLNVDPIYKYPLVSFAAKFIDISSSKDMGIIKIDVKTDSLSSEDGENNIGKSGYIYITTDSGVIINHKTQTLIGTRVSEDILSEITNNKSGSFSTTIESKEMQVNYTTSDETGWKFIAVIPTKELYASSRSIGLWILLSIIICISIGIAFSVLSTSQITKPIKNIIETTRELSTGNLTVKVKSYKLKELNELGDNFNLMCANLRKMMKDTSELSSTTSKNSDYLLDISQEITSTSQEITGAIEDIACGSTKQTDETIGCVDISENFNSKITKAIESVNKVNTLTQTSNNIIEESSKAVDKLTLASTNNKNAMRQVGDTISALNNNTKDILTILDKIKLITEQTNLLSLNASIEAARAGDAGKGFAVVASEIRKLSEKSKDASLQIKEIIKNVNNSINSSIEITNSAQNTFAEETHQVEVTVNVFESIKENINNINDVMKNTKNIIKIIDKDKDVLRSSINEIASISEKNTASTEEVTASVQNQASSTTSLYNLAQELSLSSEKLKEAINKFDF